MDYSNMSEITVRTQSEMDAIPLDFRGRICIECTATIVVSNRYYWRVEARGNSSVEARGNSSVEAWENSSVVARGNSSVEAWENSSVEARGNSSVVARRNSSVVARGNSSVEAWGNSSVEAWENSSVVARENSSVVAYANAQVVDRQICGKIQVSGNARIVYMPKNTEDFLNFYGVKHTKTKAILYKAVHKCGELYVSDYNDSFTYEVGKYAQEENLNTDVSENCGTGIHVSHLNRALNFGSNWNDLAVIEVEVKIADIILPNDSNGKVRTGKAKVLREVPLEDCGLYGKILAKRRANA